MHQIGTDYPKVNKEFLQSIGYDNWIFFIDELLENYLVSRDEKTGNFTFEHRDNAVTECWSIPHLYDWKDPYLRNNDASLCRSTISAKELENDGIAKRESLFSGTYFLEREAAERELKHRYEERQKIKLEDWRKEQHRLEKIEEATKK